MKKHHLVGKRFGCLIVETYFEDDYSRKKCTCLCDCGNSCEVFLSNILAGRTKSCGHLEKENREKFKDIKGQKFGELTVIEKTDKRKEGTIVWRCQCSCGNIVECSRRQLIRKYVNKCPEHDNKKMIGQRFGELKIVNFRRDNNGKVFFYCQCSCGNWCWVERFNLLRGHSKSCGHRKYISNVERIDGVIPGLLKSKIPKNNTSGYKGISRTKNEKWVAYITFKKKRYYLGAFNKMSDAIKARKEAEENLFDPILKQIEG
ncbi:AP2 domain-containing protein [Enterococcus faecalis]|uniref:AP2 domain-containing protein n=1 Tax=Enterococcus faecalis TaxID=1351 RepID=UPI0025501CE8|nr:AP2 domain-containing protein [Enterococcus faecalis]MDK4456683.1 AP2 domain-containing protein [Enterococcus faecalis]